MRAMQQMVRSGNRQSCHLPERISWSSATYEAGVAGSSARSPIASQQHGRSASGHGDEAGAIAASCWEPAGWDSCCCSCGLNINRKYERAWDLITVPFKFEMSGGRIVLYQPNGL